MVNNISTKVAVVVPVYNGGEDFKNCLEGIYRSDYPNFELIVVADGDTDGSEQVAQDFGAQVIKLSRSAGPATARNIGAKAASGEIIFFVDADVLIEPNTITKVVDVLDSRSDLSALIGSYDDAPKAQNFLSQYKNLLHHYTHQTSSTQGFTFWGACGAIRRDVFLSLGGFDEVYRRPCIEDIELGSRLRRSGYKIELCKQIQVKHLKHWHTWSLLKADFCDRALPWTALLLQERKLPNDLNLNWSSRLSVILIYLLLLITAVAWWIPPILTATPIIAIALLIINQDVYRFFYRQRGLIFTLQVIPWHWLYYFYSGLALAIGIIRHLIDPNRLNFQKAAKKTA